MRFRTVYITERARCSYQNGYLVVRQDDQKMVHLSEIDVVIVETTAAYMSSYLMAELAAAKIPVLFCDIQHNPVGQYMPLYGSHDNVRKIKEQIAWSPDDKSLLWQLIIKSKISNQARVLEEQGLEETIMLREYANDVQPGDISNREGHAAKVYFNALFGKGFTRDSDTPTNAKLNYGYSILLAWMSREIAVRGYLTQIGIAHRNEYNQFNLACDFMEPFRPVIDRFVVNHYKTDLDKETKIDLLRLFGDTYQMPQGKYQLSSILGLFAKTNLAILSGRLSPEAYMDFDLHAE